MTKIAAYKMDGLGNNFLIFDRRKNFFNLNRKTIIQLKNDNKIIFDQIIIIEKEVNGSFPITIYNSDGDEVAACGNGSRCVAYILGKEKNTNLIDLKTKERILKTEIVGELMVKINMGQPVFEWAKIPLSKKLNYKDIEIKIDNDTFTNGFALNVGNPHIVFFVDNCLKYDLKKIGPKIECHNLFPEKVNVSFAEILDRKSILINVWERGAGLTKACGTAACATAVAANYKNLTEKIVEVKFKEGNLKIELDKTSSIFKTGSVSKIKKINLEI